MYLGEKSEKKKARRRRKSFDEGCEGKYSRFPNNPSLREGKRTS
jgi:hypothetical protein